MTKDHQFHCRLGDEHKWRFQAIAATHQAEMTAMFEKLIDNEFTGENHDRYWPVYEKLRDGLTVKKEG